MSALLAGKTVLVTGASRGIGAAIAQAMSAEGAQVAITYRTRATEAQAVADACTGEVLVLPLEVGDRGSVEAAFDTLVSLWGGVDVLVNNAGYLHQMQFSEIDDAEWQRTLDINLKGVFLCTQVAEHCFRNKCEAAIINITSVGGQMGGTKAPHYAAAKAGVISMTKSAARLLAPARVNAIAPGFIKTDMYEQIIAETDVNEILADIPLGRVGLPQNVADAAVFLASEKASYITGHVLNVNGGLYLGA